MRDQSTLMLPPNIELTGKQVSDIVCPNCYKPLAHQNTYGPGLDDQGRMMRSYIGYCNPCAKCSEVIQYLTPKGWVVSRYRIDGGQWMIVQAPPAPPVLAIGPGGDYLSEVSDEELSGLLMQASYTLNQLGKFISTVIDLLKSRKSCKKNS